VFPVPPNAEKTSSSRGAVLVPGLLGMVNNFAPVARELAGTAGVDDVIVVDNRNHGESFHDPEMDYTVMVEDLRRLVVDELKLTATTLEESSTKKIVLVGHSMGGKVAMRFATDHPDLVEKLVIVDIAPKKYDTKAKGRAMAHNWSELFPLLETLPLQECETKKEVSFFSII